MNKDGFEDIVGGSYKGHVRWYKGTDNGFLEAEEIPQTIDLNDRSKYSEYMFTNSSFGDYNDDGLTDMFVGGDFGIRVSINIGTKECPKFSDREVLLREDGFPVTSVEYTEEKKKRVLESKDINRIPKLSPYSSFVIFTDLNSDGIGDLLVSSDYKEDNSHPLLYYEGIRGKDNKIVFSNNPISLLIAKGGGKALPGTDIVPQICDFNNDGIKDIMLGVSIRYDRNNECINDNINYTYYYSKIGMEKHEKLLSLYRTYGHDRNLLKKAQTELDKEYYVGPKLEKDPDYISIGCVILILGK